MENDSARDARVLRAFDELETVVKALRSLSAGERASLIPDLMARPLVAFIDELYLMVCQGRHTNT